METLYERTNLHQATNWFKIKPKQADYNLKKTKEKFVAQTILQRIASGENAAVQECLDNYGRLVWSLARRMCPNNADAEDAVQEIFVEIWKNAERFDDSKSSETTFIAMIARRRLIDRLRKVTRQPDLDSIEDSVYELPEDSNRDILMSIEAKQAAKAMKNLRPEQRQAIYLSIVQGCSHQEIADALGLPLGTIKTHIRRGLIEVREILDLSNTNFKKEVSA